MSKPSISSLSPTSGAIGSSVALAGSGFTGATAVSFNGVSAAGFKVSSDTAATATVPTNATTGPVVLTTPEGASAGVTYTVK